MKSILYKIFMAAVSVSGLLSCSEWVQPQSLEIEVSSLEQQNPGLWKAYLQSLNDYKQSRHQVMIAKFTNSESAPVGNSGHLDALPDSIDYVILAYADNLPEIIVLEMEEIREKGIKTMYSVSYDAIEDEYTAYCDALEASGDAEESPDTPDGSGTTAETKSFNEFLGERTDSLLSIAVRYPYDGINVIYSSKFPGSFPDEEKQELLASQELFFNKILEWKKANTEKEIFFEGLPQNLLTKGILDEAEYIIIPALSASSMERLTYEVELAMADGVPTDRFVICVTAVSVDNPKDERGYFLGTDEDGERKRAIVGASEWAVIPNGKFVKAGIAVENVQNDYFNMEYDYKYVREAIEIMNPAI